LLSAYSCTPGRGSEPGVGFETVRVAASEHNVWVLTRTKNVSPLEEYFGQDIPSGRVTVIGLDLSPAAMRLKRRLGSLGLYWYYDRWQRLARERAQALSAQTEFDLTHHVTFSSDWARAGVADSAVPFIWGPLGGGARVPYRLLPSLGARGIVAEAIRLVGRGVMRLRPWYRRAWRSASIVLVQNEENLRLAPTDEQASILPHGTALITETPTTTGARTRQILVVGRLVPWKGGYLALEAFARSVHQDTTLHLLGDGSDLQRLQRKAMKLGLADRVFFEGARPREEVLERIGHAAAVLHPAIHDESPITVGEALSLGTPVVCLDLGGPPELLRRWASSPGTAVPVTSVTETSERLAFALDQALSESHPIPKKSLPPTPTYREAVLAIYEEATAGVGDHD